MNNAEKFQEVFGYYATEMWAKPEADFLDWINEDYNTLATPKPVCEDAISKRKLMTDLQGIWDAYTPNNMTDFQDVLEDIYYKIKNAPSVTPTERTGEWIKLDEALLSTKLTIAMWCEREYLKDKSEKLIRYVHDGLYEITTISPKHGKWEQGHNGTAPWFVCSECQEAGNPSAKFCHNCGADMRGDKE